MTAKARTAFSTSELAEIALGTLFGSGDVKISGVAEIANATANDITYAVNKKYVEKLVGNEAGAAIVPRGTAKEVDLKMPLIEADNPYFSFAQLLKTFAPYVPKPAEAIHPTAIIDESAKIGENVIIGPYAVIAGNTTIGDNSHIGPGVYVGYSCVVGENCHLHHNVSIREFCTIGNRVIIHGGTIIGTDGYGFAHFQGQYHKIPQIGIVEVQDDVEIGSLVCIDRATIGKTIIGKGTKMDNLIQIGHNVELGENCALVSQVGISGSTKVGANCRFAGQAATSGHLSIGAGTTVAARGVAVKDIPAGSFVSGFPARPHKEERKIMASLPKLPTLLRRMAKLERKLAELEPEDKE